MLSTMACSSASGRARARGSRRDAALRFRDPLAPAPSVDRSIRCRVVIVEGILIFADPEIRRRFDVKIFVDTDADIRVFRRVRRDMESRGRTFAQVDEQYHRTVRPMHLEFVEPSKRFSDILIPEGGNNQVALDLVISTTERGMRHRADPDGGVSPPERDNRDGANHMKLLSMAISRSSQNGLREIHCEGNSAFM